MSCRIQRKETEIPLKFGCQEPADQYPRQNDDHENEVEWGYMKNAWELTVCLNVIQPNLKTRRCLFIYLHPLSLSLSLFFHTQVQQVILLFLFIKYRLILLFSLSDNVISFHLLKTFCKVVIS